MERSTDSWFISLIDSHFKDLRHAVRILARNPVFTLTAIAILATGIGASTAVFSAIDTVLIRPLSVADQSGVVAVWKHDILSNNPVAELSVPEFRDWQQQSTVFSSVAALPTTVYGYGYTVTGAGEPFQVESARVSAEFFTTLGVRPELGRVITEAEDQPGAVRTVVLSHALWDKHFDSDPGLIGRELTMNGLGYTVVGIMPADFDFPSGVAVWTALSTEARWTESRGAVFLQVVGRLKPDVNLRQARADLDSVIANVARQHPETKAENERAVITPLTSYVLGSTRPALFLLLGASALLLLIACTNVAGMLLGRAVSRQREFAVRAVLGAGRARVIRQLLTESLVLGAAAGLLGTALAIWLVEVCKKVAPADVPRVAGVQVNGEALWFAIVIVLVSSTMFGLAPALAASKIDLAEALKGAGTKVSASAGARVLRSAIIVAEVAITLVLAIGALLVALSFRSLQQVDLGFDPTNLVTAEVSLRGSVYARPAKRREWYRQLMERLESHPEVAASGMDLVRPLEGRIGWDVPFQWEGQSPEDVPGNPVPNFEIITPHYFRAMRIQLLAGREFTEQDTSDSDPVVIVSRRAARECFGDREAVGRRLRLGSFDSDSPWSTIVGVVADARYRALDDPRLNVYVPYTQRNFPGRYVMIRVNGGAGSASSAATVLREEVTKLDGTQAVSGVTTMDVMVRRALARPRFSMILLGSFASIAVLLATIGVYGIVSYTVSERTREIGIRVVLGARSRGVLMMVTGGVLKLALAGILAGLAITLATTRIISGMLYGVSARDPVVFGSVALMLLLAALAASYLPARRATKVDPAVALRHE